MRAISLHQPYASLLVLGMKRFETRSWPAPNSIIGTRVAFHATKKRPKDVWQSSSEDVDFPATLAPFYDYGRYVDPQESNDGEWWRYRWDGPLGAIVGSGVIAASIEVVASARAATEMAALGVPSIFRSRDSKRLHWLHQHPEDPRLTGTADITSEDPFGDFSVGRHAWLIEDAVPTTEICPWCNGDGGFKEDSMILYGIPGGMDWAYRCSACKGEGRCPPIPAVGRQGFWNWDADAV